MWPRILHVCTSCDQLRYKCSVVKCNPNKYKACSPDIVESSLTGFKSVDDTKWIYITYKLMAYVVTCQNMISIR